MIEEEGIEIPWQQLSDEALLGLLEEYASREGTEYGWQEVSLERKVEQLKSQLLAKKVKVVFDQNTETANLVTVL